MNRLDPFRIGRLKAGEVENEFTLLGCHSSHCCVVLDLNLSVTSKEFLAPKSYLEDEVVPEAGIDRAVACGLRSWPPDNLRGAFQNDLCAANDRPQVAVWGCAGTAQSTRMTIRSGDFKSYK